eukprot:TRINITY_DN11667_c0_g1_i1.p1 TRINITY_DN11667_c0_g1~~TRINITY_DN11667_c0_g1_i1.p1  ORF type:complete len:476 (-),score=146.00 TRINITY_DN11667_c0_g1_i1:22-1449(-)
MLQVKAVIHKVEGIKRGEALASVIKCVRDAFIDGVTPVASDIPSVPIEMMVSLITTTNAAPLSPASIAKNRTLRRLPAVASCSQMSVTIDVPYKTGYLSKKSKIPLKPAQKRWCVLNGHNFTIFKSSIQSDSKKVIKLEDITGITMSRSGSGFTLRSKVKTAANKEENYSVRFDCDLDTEAARWVLSVDAMIGQTRRASAGAKATNGDGDAGKHADKELELPLSPSAMEARLIDETRPEPTALDPATKAKLLRIAYMLPYAGGVMKSSTYDEEWKYTRQDASTKLHKGIKDNSVEDNLTDGTIVNASWGGELLQYRWDGQWMYPMYGSQMSLGVGCWNGGYLSWFAPANVSVAYQMPDKQDDNKAAPRVTITATGEPFIKYLYVPHQLSYVAVSHRSHPDMTWTWVRHFLVSSCPATASSSSSSSLSSASSSFTSSLNTTTPDTSSNGGEWLKEGHVPEPVVMLLQMLRYYRTGR